MSTARPSFYEMPSKSLYDEYTSIDTKHSSQDKQTIHTILLGRSDGWKKLSSDLENYPGIDDAIKQIKSKPADTKAATASTYNTMSSYFNYGALYAQSFLKIKVNVTSAAEAKKIADDVLVEHKQEATRGHASLSDRATLKALKRLRPVYDNTMTNGSVKKAMADLFTSYLFPLDEKAFDEKLTAKAHEFNMHLTIELGK